MAKHKNNLCIAAMGDVMLTRDVGEHFAREPADFSMSEIRALLEPVDLVIANLENPVSDKGEPHHIQDPHVTFCANPDILCVLKNLGVNVVSLGNNHMLDYGGVALSATLEHLDSRDIHHVGAGRNYTEANTPLEIVCGSHQVAILSHSLIYSASTLMARKNSPGISDHRIRKILRRIRTLKDKGRLVMVSLHWGIEYCFYPLPYQMAYARRMIDAGAHVILGHGPHYPQGNETYKNGLIIYSLGNFMFDEPFRFSNKSHIAEVEIDAETGVTRFDMHPFEIKSHIPRLMNGQEGKRHIELIEKLTDLYQEKDAAFWRKINLRFLGDIQWRVRSMKSFKFLFLYPMEFYLNVGLLPVLRKVKKKAVAKLSRLCSNKQD